MIVASLLVRNEAGVDRYLRRVLENARSFCDKLVIVDDGSTDDTPAICAEFGTVERLDSDGWWGRDESVARALSWRLAAAAAGPDGWVFIFDADHLLEGITPPELERLVAGDTVNAWACPLWDAWDSESRHRVDGLWQAWRPESARVWLAKAQPTSYFVPEWPEAGVHSGHLPANYPVRAGRMPYGAGIRHLGYVNKEHRRLKRDKYLSCDTH